MEEKKFMNPFNSYTFVCERQIECRGWPLKALFALVEIRDSTLEDDPASKHF